MPTDDQGKLNAATIVMDGFRLTPGWGKRANYGCSAVQGFRVEAFLNPKP